MKIRLENVKGEFLKEIEIPPYDPAPGIVCYGKRFYVKQKKTTTYREAFCYVWRFGEGG